MNRGRAGIVAVMVVALILSAVTRDWARALRRSDDVLASGDAASLANMNSFALALLLGGLRGPLVMILWTSSENQKNERNLEDFDTQVEWIRLLQPEFDSVHIFQVWNKAYNISVQMASLANKYSTILDAIDYARRVLAQRPNNINMVYAIGSIYLDKLGTASEKNYYRHRVRAESYPNVRVSVPKERAAELASAIRSIRMDAVDAPRRDELAAQAAREGRIQTNMLIARALEDALDVTIEQAETRVLLAGERRARLDPKLKLDGEILEELLEPRFERPADLPADTPFNDGSELQYLRDYGPFPYGLSTFALGYNYHKQAQVLQEVGKQRHVNLSQMVVHSRPGGALRNWSEEEWERARALELWSFNLELPEELREREIPTANIAPDTPFTSRGVLEEAIYSYGMSARLAGDSIVESERHLRHFGENLSTLQSTMDSLRAQRELMLGDRDYLKAMLSTGEERRQHLQSAAEHYRQSRALNYLVILRYYMNDALAPQVLPEGMTRHELRRIPPQQYPAMYQKMRELLAREPIDPDAEDRSDYERYVQRAETRLKRIEEAK